MTLSIDQTTQARLFQVANLDALAKIGPLNRQDRDMVYCVAEQTLFLFDADSADGASSGYVVVPVDGEGRYIRQEKAKLQQIESELGGGSAPDVSYTASAEDQPLSAAVDVQEALDTANGLFAAQAAKTTVILANGAPDYRVDDGLFATTSGLLPANVQDGDIYDIEALIVVGLLGVGVNVSLNLYFGGVVIAKIANWGCPSPAGGVILKGRIVFWEVADETFMWSGESAGYDSGDNMTSATQSPKLVCLGPQGWALNAGLLGIGVDVSFSGSDPSNIVQLYSLSVSKVN